MIKFTTQNAHDRDFVRKIEEISGENFHKCMQCGTCSGTCPVTDFVNMTTRKLMLLAHMGLKEQIAAANTAWYCAACQACAVRCPRGIDIPRVMEAVRQLTLRTNQNFVHPNEIPEEALAELPPIALVASFRKHTS